MKLFDRKLESRTKRFFGGVGETVGKVKGRKQTTYPRRSVNLDHFIYNFSPCRPRDLYVRVGIITQPSLMTHTRNSRLDTFTTK